MESFKKQHYTWTLLNGKCKIYRKSSSMQVSKECSHSSNLIVRCVHSFLPFVPCEIIYVYVYINTLEWKIVTIEEHTLRRDKRKIAGEKYLHNLNVYVQGEYTHLLYTRSYTPREYYTARNYRPKIRVNSQQQIVSVRFQYVFVYVCVCVCMLRCSP